MMKLKQRGNEDSAVQHLYAFLRTQKASTACQVCSKPTQELVLQVCLNIDILCSEPTVLNF